jgi:MATE family multidrug resistance protein
MITNTLGKYKHSAQQAFKLALPIITGQLGLVLMGFFDTVQVGGLGATYMAASGVSNSVYFLFILLAMGTIFSVSPLVSEALGEKHEWKAIGIMRSATGVTLVLSVLFYVIMLVVVANFALFREGENITVMAQKFLRILNYSTPMLLLFTLGKQFMDGLGRTKVSMAITLVGLVCNVFLNWILIYGKLGCPALGIEGAAIATATSRTIMCVGLWIYILQDKQVKQLVHEYHAQKAESKSYIKPILEIGVPSGLQMFFEVGAFSAAQIMSGWISELSLASYQVAISLASITFMMASGLAAAGTIMTGFAFGARDKEGLRMAGNTVYIFTAIAQAFFACVFLIFNKQLPGLYTSNAEVMSTASDLILFAALFQLSDGFQVVGAGILRGMQDVKIPSVIAFTSYWIIMVPACYLLAFNAGLQVTGIWIGFVIGLSVAALLMYLRFRVMLNKVEFIDL